MAVYTSNADLPGCVDSSASSLVAPLLRAQLFSIRQQHPEHTKYNEK
ncbi:MAG: hypothetical protein JJT96_16095 [Opitutales bacterium]|nr:hypothetical protein [Opitutales bacterium]